VQNLKKLEENKKLHETLLKEINARKKNSELQE